MKEREVIEQIEDVLKSIHLPDKHYQKLKLYIRDTLKTEKSQHQERVFEMQKQREAIETQIDRLTDLLLNDHITQEAHDRKHSHLQLQHHEITTRLNEQYDNSDNLENALYTFITLLNKAQLVIKSSKTTEIRSLLKTLFSNFSLHGRNLCYTLVSPLSECCNVVDYKEWLSIIDVVRKYHSKDVLSIHNRISPELRTIIDSV